MERQSLGNQEKLINKVAPSTQIPGYTNSLRFTGGTFK